MQSRKKWLLFLPVLAVYAIGLPVEVMEVDAAQYAEISREMLETGDFLQLYCRGNDYLDKPPFLFWITSLSYALLGVTTVTYKLPSVLFALLGVFSTYRLGKRLYNETTGFAAALMLATTQAWFQFTNDVRTDTILAGVVIFAVWQLTVFIAERRWVNFFGAALGISIAMLTKGPIGLMVPVLALGTDLLLKRRWKMLFRWEWLAMALLVLLALSPMLWGLYRQFDLHPGKIINGQEIRSGIRFYFWTQSFGRLTGESNWSNDPSLTGFLPVLGWAFLPWTFFLLAGLWMKTKDLGSAFRGQTEGKEWITWGGFLFPFIALSLSNYKLPHYIFVLFPLGAIMAADYLARIFGRNKNAVLRANGILLTAVTLAYLAAAGLLLFYVFPADAWKWILVLVLFVGFLLLVLRSPGSDHLLTLGTSGAVIFNLVMNFHFYPGLLYYQAPTRAAKFYLYEEVLTQSDRPVTAFYALGYSFDFYAQHTMTYHEKIDALKESFRGKEVWIYTDDKGLQIIKDTGIPIRAQQEFEDFKVTHISLKFLDPGTRDKAIKRKFLVLVQC